MMTSQPATRFPRHRDRHSSFSRLSAILVLGFVLLTGCATDGQRRTSAPVAPRRAGAVVSAQLIDYFGARDLRGVPVLDTTVDWRDFDQWPERFFFNDVEYRIKLSARSPNVIRSILSLDDLAPGEQWLAQYEAVAGPPAHVLAPMGVWYENGAIKELGASLNGNNIFILQYYPTGRFFMINFTEARTRRYHVEVYDRAGQLRGELIGQGREARFTWDQRRVRRQDFNRRLGELYRNESRSHN